MPIPEQVTHQECEVPKIESGGEAGGEDDEELDPTDARRYQAITFRINYLAVDRVDIQNAVKEAARTMNTPRRSNWSILQKIRRYLVGTPRLVMKFPWQDAVTTITADADSDWAGCHKTAGSRSGGIVTFGGHVKNVL